MKVRQILVGIGIIGLLLGSASLSSAWAQAVEPAPAGGEAGPPGQPPQTPPSPGGGEGTDQPDGPEQPGEPAEPGGPEGAGPGGAGPTMPGARPGVEGGDAQDPNAPDDNRGFPTDQFPEDIKKQLEAIMPQGEPSSTGKLSMAFSKTEIEDFLQFLSTESGYTILPPAELSGTITIVSRVEVSLEDAFSILEAWLRLRSFTTMRDDARKIMSIIPLTKARTRPREVRGPDLPIDGAEPNDIITQVVLIKNVEAAKVAELLTPLIDAEWAQMTASADLNALLITDTAGNIERLMQIVQELDRESEPVTIEVMPLQFAPAKETADLLNQILGQSGPVPAEMLQRMGIDPATIPQGPQGFIGATQRVKVQPDERTNSLVILASEARLEMIRSIVKQLDVDMSAKVAYRVFQLKSADATQVADMLNQIFEQPQGGPGQRQRQNPFADFFDMMGGGRRTTTTKSLSGLKENVVVADTRTNSVIVTASEGNMKAFEDMIRKLDEAKSLSDLTHVYKLKNAMATDLADVLGQAFQGGRRRTGGGFLDMIFGGFGGGRSSSTTGPLEKLRDITVTAEEKSNSLIITGPPQAFEMVDQIIADLDKPQKQVYISVIVADVTLTDELRYGVEWDWFTKSNPSFSGTSNFGLSGWDQGIRWGVIGDSLQGFLEALNQKTSIRVISTPSILTLDNVEGKITSGREVTVKQGQRESAGGSVSDVTARVTAAITLLVTPHINGNSCRLTISQVVDDLGQADSYGNPEIIKREAKAEVLVGTGETVVLGGIIQEDERITRKDVPVLSEIPLIGQLFKSKDIIKRRSELMVFITPYVMADQETGNRELPTVESIRRSVEEDLRTRFPNLGDDVTRYLRGAETPIAPSTSSGARESGGPATPATKPEEPTTEAWPPITRGAGRN